MKTLLLAALFALPCSAFAQSTLQCKITTGDGDEQAITTQATFQIVDTGGVDLAKYGMDGQLYARAFYLEVPSAKFFISYAGNGLVTNAYDRFSLLDSKSGRTVSCEAL